jgi:hypothetical protein
MNKQQTMLCALVAMALLTGCDHAQGRFNLSCRAHPNDRPALLRVDLNKNQWCTDPDCTPEPISKVTHDRITLEDDVLMTIYVDRPNARLVSSMHAPGAQRLEVTASCVTQPFTGFPSKQPPSNEPPAGAVKR